MEVGERSPGLPMRSDSDIMAILLSEDQERDQSEPEVASSIGEQMLHMDIPLLPRSIRARIRDVCSRISPKNAVIIGGGIGHLSAWLFDLWSPINSENEKIQTNRPESLRIIEPGKRFCVIIERLIRRYEAGDWAQVVSMNWQEVIAETISSRASNVSIDESALNSDLPMPLDLVVVDLPEDDRADAAKSVFELVSPGTPIACSVSAGTSDAEACLERTRTSSTGKPVLSLCSLSIPSARICRLSIRRICTSNSS